ncbi:MAG TPA: 16S rRNA (cytidine(1402)-2'-O)-methyltransferase [Thermomicrobiales bacterium]|nr:16S rRNA (cytidine(1402)-2'-O)-methyltransferase [Thermomicrobiales bacterium]
MGVLYVVATPIGNLEDLSPRARRILGDVSLVAAEDTRHTGSMLRRLGIGTPLISNHGFNERSRVERLLEALADGDVALVSDAGTPAISDPGAIFVRAAAEAGYKVIPIPGPSAVTAAVSASGLVDGQFLFVGFLPRASGERDKTLSAALKSGVPLVLYESGNRINALCESLESNAPNREIAVFRELTKLHEQAIRGVAADLSTLLTDISRKGEFVVVVGVGAETNPVDLDQLIRHELAHGRKASDIARELAKQTDQPRSEIYDRVLVLSKTDNQGA